MYSRVYHGDTLLTIGCKVSCEKVNIERKCCAGYYGINCEKCPGPEGQSCFGNGVCVDGINGTGVCQCNQGFNGTACETCQAGKYGIHCDQECKCVNGRCKEGLDGDGSCTCDLGWRGINCNVDMMLTCRTNAHTYIWMPCTIGVYRKYNVKIKDVDFSAITSDMCRGKCHSSAKERVIANLAFLGMESNAKQSMSVLRKMDVTGMPNVP